MRKLEKLNKNIKYSSEAFAEEMRELSQDIDDSVHIDLAGRSGERNLIRNSGQYWRAVGLIPPGRDGVIRLTDFGRKVADREISQAEFAAFTIQTFSLPNPQTQSSDEIRLWQAHNLRLHPLKLLLEILQQLKQDDPLSAYISPRELLKIIVPLSGCHAEIEEYRNFILWHRDGKVTLENWPVCGQRSNDFRIAREYLRS